jgi:hypothetical protein
MPVSRSSAWPGAGFPGGSVPRSGVPGFRGGTGRTGEQPLEPASLLDACSPSRVLPEGEQGGTGGTFPVLCSPCSLCVPCSPCTPCSLSLSCTWRPPLIERALKHQLTVPELVDQLGGVLILGVAPRVGHDMPGVQFFCQILDAFRALAQQLVDATLLGWQPRHPRVTSRNRPSRAMAVPRYAVFGRFVNVSATYV